MSCDRVRGGAEVPLREEIRVDVVVGDRAVLVGTGDPVDAEPPMRVVVAERAPEAGGLDEQLEAAVRDGFACSVEELEDGLNTIAAPIRDHTGQVIAALSVSGPAYRFTRQRLDEVAPEVIAAAAAISDRMGHLD